MSVPAKRTTAQSDTGSITRLLLRSARDAFGSQDRLDRQWRTLNYAGCPDYRRAADDYDIFSSLLTQAGAEVVYLPAEPSLTIDSVYVRDAAITTDRGVILGNMGKPDRAGEPDAMGRFLEANRLPILGRIAGTGRLEGGDLIWLDERTIVVGRGYRTNAEGIRQLRELAHDLVDEIIVVDLPHWNGPGDVMHLMSNISPIAPGLALIYSRLLTATFRQLLLERGFNLVEVPDEEYDSMGCNVLALGQDRCLAVDGNPVTRKRLEQAGIEVLTYDGREISLKGAGGPTCLTRPIERIA